MIPVISSLSFRISVSRICFLGCCFCLLILSSCEKKQESLFAFELKEPKPEPPPATGKDTVVSVTALLNGVDFQAVGRGLKPEGFMQFSFYDFETGGFLEIKLGADTPGVYKMGRNIPTNTAVYFSSLDNKTNKLGYTSRATEEAGGIFTVVEIDTVNYKIKGSFELLLLSRTLPERYEFKNGLFEIIYNNAEMDMDGNMLYATNLPFTGLNRGAAAAPRPELSLGFPEGVLSISINTYKGLGTYTQNDDVVINFEEQATGKKYLAESFTINLVRYNFGEFMQAFFECILVSEDGATKEIKNGSLVIGKLEN